MKRAIRALGMALAVLALIGSAEVQAQDTFEVRGTVTDSVGTTLERAMVVALLLPDSTLTSFGTTNGEGAFTLRRVPAGDYLLQVQLASFETIRTPFSVVDRNVDLGATTMASLVYGMEPLTVSVDHVPFQNRRDTLIFNAAAFQVRPNANVEELLRRLPGFEVSDDGTIQVQGEQVQKVLVEGKEFFGNDPTVATRGLPADAVESVEVFDKESDMAEFTGSPDGNEQLTLNLRLTEDAQRGYFGEFNSSLGASERASGGLSQAGDGARYEQQIGINRFSPTTQFAVSGGLNNVSRARFSVAAVEVARGGGGGFAGGGGGGGGFTRSGTLGVNLSRQFSDDDWLRGSWFYNDLSRQQQTNRLQQQLLGSDVASIIANDGSDLTDNQSHRISLNGQKLFSPGNQLRLRAGFNLSDQTSTDITDRSTSNASGGLVNTEYSTSVDHNEGLSGSGNLTWMKRLGESGRSLVFSVSGSLSRPEVTGDQSSLIEVFGSNSSTITEILQTREQSSRSLSMSERLALTQPLGEGRQVEVFVERRDNHEDESRNVFDIIGGAPVINDRLTSGLDQTYGYYAGGFRLNRNTDKTRVVLGLQAQRSSLEGVIDGRDETIANQYTRFLPSADFRLTLNEQQNLSFRYNTTTREPSMQELQPFTDNRSPTNLYVGNPDLQPEYTHSVNSDWRYFDAFSFLNVFAFARVSRTGDDIVTSRTIDDRGFQTLMPVNAGASWSSTGGLNFGRPIRPLHVNLSVDYQASLTHRAEFINNDENKARILGNSVGLSVQNREKDRFDLQARVGLQFNNVAYSLNDELDQSYMNSSYSLRGTAYLGAWTLGGDWAWQRYDPDVFGDVENVALVNMTLSRYVLNERGSIELSANDLMNEGQAFSLSSSPNAITETRSAALGRYMMLQFNWRLGNLGGRGRR